MKHHQPLRRGLSVLLSLVMCLSLLPATALAEGTEPATSVEINDTNFPDENFVKHVKRFDTNNIYCNPTVNLHRIENCP